MSQWLEDVYREHRQGLFTLSLAITQSRQQAEDAVHEAFVRLVESDVPAGNPVAYVYRAVRNSAIDSSRSNQRRQKLTNSIFNGYSSSSSNNRETCPRMSLLTRERDQILRQAIQELPDAQQVVVVLKTFSGLTFEQASEVLQVPAKTVATRYRRALMKLEERLKGQL